ncbi:uncharacterized protein B0T23DRAFT_54439 [Neurospora hispaniola]|uniref:EF-hand domain-containing protein n=1 Tax=Neurospora hispaniola TaxID=588809 RepID=A0AAJ0MLI8_9PEZI|nr:hypothetical protein B0T23DRAFT_54439 [Neurospora hispaniola]
MNPSAWYWYKVGTPSLPLGFLSFSFIPISAFGFTHHCRAYLLTGPGNSHFSDTMASQDALRNAFQSGDRDGDNTLSVREAVTAVQALGGRTLDAKQLERACNDCGVDTGREMDFDEFVKVVRKLEGEGTL